MAYSYSSGYYEDNITKELATGVLEAYADGVPFETLIKKNKAVRQFWHNIQSERAAKLKRAEQEKTRLAKLAEKQAAEKALREEVMSKLSKEELEAFGLVKKGKR
jgi:ribosomal protein L9